MGYSAGAFHVEIAPLRRTTAYLDTLRELMVAVRPVVDGSRAAAGAHGVASPAMAGFSRRLQAALHEVAADVAQDRERLEGNVRDYAATEDRLRTGYTSVRPGSTAPMARTRGGHIVDRP